MLLPRVIIQLCISCLRKTELERHVIEDSQGLNEKFAVTILSFITKQMSLSDPCIAKLYATLFYNK